MMMMMMRTLALMPAGAKHLLDGSLSHGSNVLHQTKQRRCSTTKNSSLSSLS
jgi:hypothetical protein